MFKPSVLVAEEPTTDLLIVEAMANELEPYLIGDDLYHTLRIRTPEGDYNMQMTGADLLTRLHRLQGERADLAPAEQSRLNTLKARVDATVDSLHTRFQERLQREIKARLDSLKWFLDDCPADRQRCRVDFPFEMRNRQRVEEALKLLDYQLPEELQRTLQKIDSQLRQIATPSEFLWDERWRSIFPPQPYWYLYLRP
ncbi:MAG: hypothetical protein R3E79_46930 [Caldilineaceae bacterium]